MDKPRVHGYLSSVVVLQSGFTWYILLNSGTTLPRIFLWAIWRSLFYRGMSHDTLDCQPLSLSNWLQGKGHYVCIDSTTIGSNSTLHKNSSWQISLRATLLWRRLGYFESYIQTSLVVALIISWHKLKPKLWFGLDLKFALNTQDQDIDCSWTAIGLKLANRN